LRPTLEYQLDLPSTKLALGRSFSLVESLDKDANQLMETRIDIKSHLRVVPYQRCCRSAANARGSEATDAVVRLQRPIGRLADANRAEGSLKFDPRERLLEGRESLRAVRHQLERDLMFQSCLVEQSNVTGTVEMA
jgi:hypothetical protein